MMTAATFTHADSCEAYVVSAVLQHPEALSLVRPILQPDDCEKVSHRLILQACYALLDRREAVDLLTVVKQLIQSGDLERAGGWQYCEQLASLFAPAANSEQHARIVKQRAIADRAKEIGRAIVNGNGGDPEPVIASAIERLTALRGALTPTAAVSFTHPVSDLLNGVDEPLCYLVERLVVSGACGWIGGEPKSLKSWLALYLGLCIALKVSVFGRYTVPAAARVLYLQEEDGERRVRRRTRQILTGLGVGQPADEYFRYCIKAGILLDDERWIEALRAELAEYRPALVICDVFEAMHTKDSNENAEMKPILYALDRLREEFGCGFLLVDHFKKSTIGASKRGGQRLSGSVRKHAWGESSIYLYPGLRKDEVRVETELKDGPSETFTLALEDTEDGGVEFVWKPEEDERAAEMKAKVLEAVSSVSAAGEWVRAKVVSEAAGVSVNTGVKWLNVLVDEDGKLERDKKPVGKTNAWHWRLRA
jgi:hypothetical protein